jgi:hypothetical protein
MKIHILGERKSYEIDSGNLVIAGLGQRYPLEFHGDGPRVVFHPSGLEILFAMSKPNEYEIGSFKAARETKIGFAKWDRLGILLIDFGEGFSVEVPFDAGIEKPDDVPCLDITSDFARVSFTFIAVDPANDNKIFGMRYITASPRVSRLLVKVVKAQLSAPVDTRTYTSRMAELYARYPTPKSLEKIALAYDKAGIDDVGDKQATIDPLQWPREWGLPELLNSGAALIATSGHSLSYFLNRVLAGDYGNAGGNQGALRSRSERFSAVFEVADGTLYFSINERGRTIVCSYMDR